MSFVDFYVRLPENDKRDPLAVARRTDKTVQVFAATFRCPFGEILCEEDGTFEVRAPSETADMVRRALEEAGFSIAREVPSE